MNQPSHGKWVIVTRERESDLVAAWTGHVAVCLLWDVNLWWEHF